MSTVAGLAIVVCSELVESTASLARARDDWMEQQRRAHMQEVGGVVAAAGGRVVKTLDDRAMALFERALGALDAAAGIRASVERQEQEGVATH